MTAATSDVDQLGIIVASELARHPVQIRACRVYRTRHIGLGLRPELARDDAFVGAGHLCPPREGKSLVRLPLIWRKSLLLWGGWHALGNCHLRPDRSLCPDLGQTDRATKKEVK